MACNMQTAADELRELRRDMTDLELLRRELGAYFCEDEATFKLDDCIKTFSAFFNSFVKAIEVYSSMCSALYNRMTYCMRTHLISNRGLQLLKRKRSNYSI